MGQCVSRKAGAVIAASGYSPSYRIMEKKPSKNKGDNKSASKRGAPHTRGTAISFGFRRRPAGSGIPVPVTSNKDQHQRSKSVGPEQESRRHQTDDEFYQPSSRYQNYSSSGRSTPRLAPPKKESSGLPIRTNRFGFRTQQPRFTDKVTDLSFNNHTVGHFNQDKTEQFQNLHNPHHQELQQDGSFCGRQSRSPQTQHQQQQQIKPRPSPVNQPSYVNNNNNNNNFSLDANRRSADISTPVGKYTLHTSHLPLPQYAVRMTDTTSKIAKTAANQSRKVGAPSRMAVGTCSSKEGSGTEDSGMGSQHGGCSDENGGRARFDYYDPRQTHSRPRKLNVMVSGKGFDVRDVDEDHTITEISVIPLPKNLGQAPSQLHHASPNLNLSTGLVRERANQYQRNILKDNRYTDSTTSMSTTSSEGYDEGLGEEKVYKDRSRSEKLPASSSSSMMRSADFSPVSSDEQEFGHGGEAMADEYSLSSSEDYNQRADALPVVPCNTVTQTTTQHFKAISNAAKSGALPKSTLRSVLLTIEDPAFAAVAATTTTLIDDETSPVDSLFDSPTASVSQSDVKLAKKESNVMERSGNTIDDDSPGTPTNASNSLSLSEGREFFDDEIADQPGLVFDETLRDVSTANTEYSQTILETAPKINTLQGRSVENSPMHGRKMNRVGSVSTLSSCESLASDDLMMDYERSDASSFGDVNSRGNSTFVMQDLEDATDSLLDLEIQGQEVMKDWNSFLGQSHQTLSNSTNNNTNIGLNNNQNTDSGLANNRTARLLSSRSSTESPRSLDSTRRQLFSPLKSTRNVQSPSLDSGDEGSLRIERGTYSYMFQDIVSIKTMLLKLKRVLQESGENGLTRTDTLNPFDNTLKNGLFYNLNDGNTTTDASTSPNDGRDAVADELADLRRQVVFLQGQGEDKDRMIQSLQSQLAKYQNANNGEIINDNSPTLNGKGESKETSNAATQTEKLRPVSAGPSILQGLPQDNGMGPLVSWSDSWSSQQSASQRSSGLSDVSSITGGKLSSASSSRRSSSDSQRAALRGLRLGNGQAQQQSPPESPKIRAARTKSVEAADGATTTTPPPTAITRSAIPTPRRLAAPTLIPRAARAVSATGRAHNS